MSLVADGPEIHVSGDGRPETPFALSFTVNEEQFRQAAEQWDAERAPSPTALVT